MLIIIYQSGTALQYMFDMHIGERGHEQTH